MIERLPEIDDVCLVEEGVEPFGRGRCFREERRKVVRREMAQVINNPAGTRQIREEEHGVTHSEFRGNLPGHKKGQGQRRVIYMKIFAKDWQRLEPPIKSPCRDGRKVCSPRGNDFENCSGEIIFRRVRVRHNGTVFGAPLSQEEIDLLKSSLI
jgi:hypothetical protein